MIALCSCLIALTSHYTLVSLYKNFTDFCAPQNCILNVSYLILTSLSRAWVFQWCQEWDHIGYRWDSTYWTVLQPQLLLPQQRLQSLWEWASDLLVNSLPRVTSVYDSWDLNYTLEKLRFQMVSEWRNSFHCWMMSHSASKAFPESKDEHWRPSSCGCCQGVGNAYPTSQCIEEGVWDPPGPESGWTHKGSTETDTRVGSVEGRKRRTKTPEIRPSAKSQHCVLEMQGERAHTAILFPTKGSAAFKLLRADGAGQSSAKQLETSTPASVGSVETNSTVTVVEKIQDQVTTMHASGYWISSDSCRGRSVGEYHWGPPDRAEVTRAASCGGRW